MVLLYVLLMVASYLGMGTFNLWLWKKWRKCARPESTTDAALGMFWFWWATIFWTLPAYLAERLGFTIKPMGR